SRDTPSSANPGSPGCRMSRPRRRQATRNSISGSGTAPAGTPGPIVDRLNAALRHALADATVRKTFDEGGMELFPPDQQTPEAASSLLKREIKLWGDVIRANDIAAQ